MDNNKKELLEMSIGQLVFSEGVRAEFRNSSINVIKKVSSLALRVKLLFSFLILISKKFIYKKLLCL